MYNTAMCTACFEKSLVDIWYTSTFKMQTELLKSDHNDWPFGLAEITVVNTK